MTNALAIAGRELRALFLSPIAWVVLFVWLVVMGFWAFVLVKYYGDPRVTTGGQPILHLLYNFIVPQAMLAVIAPVVTMRLVAEEKRSGSLELLMTAPVTELQVVMGKFAGAWAFVLLITATTIPHAWVMLANADPAPDMGPVLGTAIGLVLLTGMLTALGLFTSSLTSNQVVAAVMAVAVALVLYSLQWISFQLQDGGTAARVVDALRPDLWMDEMSRGLVDSRGVVVFVALTALFLWLTVRTLESRRWA